MQNLSRDMYEDADFIYNINTSMISIYLWLNKHGRWFFTKADEVISPVEWSEGKLFKPQHKILGLINKEKSWGWPMGLSIFESESEDKEIEFYPYSVDKGANGATFHVDQWDGDTEKMTYDGIKTTQSYDQIFLKYVRSPVLWTPENQSEIDIDMPYELLKALELKVKSMLFTQPYLEQWADLSGFWASQYEQEITNYASSYGISVDINKRFTN